MTDKKKPNNKRIKKLFSGMEYEDPDTEPRRKDEDVSGQDELESAESNIEAQETVLDESEAQASDLNTQEPESISPGEVPAEDIEAQETVLDEAEAQASDLKAQESENIPPTEVSADDQVEEAEAVESEENVSADDLLEDVRQSLIEEASKEEDKKPRWWKRIGRGGRKEEESAEDIPVEESVIEAASVEMPAATDLVEETQDEYSEQIDELIDMLEPESEPEEESTALIPEVTTTQEMPEVVIDVEEMKKQAFHRTADDKEEDFSAVRAVALDDDEEVFVEVESKAEDQFEDRLKAFENALKPYSRYIYFSLTFVGVVALVVASVILYGAYKRSLPPEPAQQNQADLLPYPVAMNLPGGLSFNLGRGTLQDGKWNPSGPEWLEGTEVCRWVAIPWSRQLEAVVRTLTRDDSIELIMSNNDRIKYDVYSIEQLTIEDMQKRSSNSPCLMLVLAEANTDKRWVVTANP